MIEFFWYFFIPYTLCWEQFWTPRSSVSAYYDNILVSLENLINFHIIFAPGRGARKKKKVVQEEVYDFEEEADSEDDGRRKSSKKGRNSVGARESAKKSKGRPSRGEASSAKKGKVPTLKIKLGGRSGKRSKNASSDEEDEEQGKNFWF